MTQLEETIRDLNNRMACAARDGAGLVHITRGCAARVLFYLRQLDGDKALDTSRLLMHLNNLQLSNAPFEEAGQKDEKYQKGVYDGLELAFQSVKEWMEAPCGAESPKGEWIHKRTIRSTLFECSVCGGVVYYPQPRRTRAAESEKDTGKIMYARCPYCGTSMKTRP